MTRGFTALVSVVTIAGFLLAAVATASYAGFYARASMLAFEGREASRAAARACAESVQLKLLYEPKYVGDDTYTLNENIHCRIGRVESADESKRIRVRVSSDISHVNRQTELEVIIDSQSRQVVTMQEIPNAAQ